MLVTVDIVYPASVSGSENYSSEAPLGPIALYSSLSEPQQRTVRFLDSTVLSQAEIEQAVIHRKADVVALSCTTYNYANAIRVAEIAKANGSHVVCGGIHITHLRDRILAKMLCGERPIDFLVTGYGEPAFGSLLAALSGEGELTQIPNLSFIKDGRITINALSNARYGDDPLTVPLDYSGVDFKRYSEKFKPYGNLSSTRIPGSTFTQRGCAYAGPRKCSFCSIEQINPRRLPELFEQDVISLITKHQADHIRITDADFTVDARHMSHMADAAERAYAKTGVRPRLHCFTRADEIDEERAALLKRLNVVSLFIGYESGSDKMLDAMNKNMRRDQNLLATALLRDYGIDVICGGLVLGAEGENEATLLESLQLVKELKVIGNTGALVATPLIPLPGSQCFARLLQRLAQDDPAKFSELSVADDFNLEELIALWNKHFCNVPLARIIETCNEIAELLPVGIRLINLQR